MFSKVLLVLAGIFFLSGCTEIEYASHLTKKYWLDDEDRTSYAGSSPDKPVQEGNFKIGNPYKIDGRWYYPKEDYDLTETGIASWYGPGFHGKRTANGEVFDKNELTAAHRTLQMPSLVRVTNLDNGRSLIVRVNDRGPYKRGRIMDVSEKAAELLGFKAKGTAKVRLQVLKEESLRIAQTARTGESTKGYEVAMNTGQQPSQYYQSASVQPVTRETVAGRMPGPKGIQTALPGHLREGQFYPDPVITEFPVTPTGIYVQAGSFGVYDNAVRLRERLQAYASAAVQPAQVAGKQFFRVRLGPVGSVEEADELLARMVQNGFNESIIVVE